MIPVTHYQLTMYQLAAIPRTWLSLAGYINASLMTANYMSLFAPPECAMYNGLTVSRYRTTAGVSLFTATLDFTIKMNGGLRWNVLWRSDHNQYEYVKHVCGKNLTV
jgi:hypothetical protein